MDAWPFVPTSCVLGARSGRGEVGRHAGLGRMALGLDREVADELVAVLDAVFEEEAVTHGVVGHVVLDAQVVRAVHGHAAVVGVVDRGVLDVLALARRRPDASGSDSGPAVRCWPMRLSSTPATIHLARGHRHDVAAEEGLLRIGRGLDLDVARQQAHFAALIHVEGDLAEVHVVELLVERDRVAADGGRWCAARPAADRSPSTRGRSRRRRASPRRSAPRSKWLPASAVLASLVQVLVRSPCRFSVPPEIMMPRSPMPAMTSSPSDVVGEGDGGLARVRAGFAADGQLAVQHDPLGGQLQVGVVRRR